MSKTTLRILIAALLATIILLVPAGATRPSASAAPQNLCGTPAPGHAVCLALVLGKTSTGSGGSAPSGLGPVQIHTAYSLPCTPGGAPTSSPCRAPKTFGPQTIAIITADDNPTIESDLGVYDTAYKLPACTRANGCLQILNQTGGTALPTTVSGPWATESALDVELSHMTCQTCKILLLEANSSADPDLAAAANEAAVLDATAISLSYGSGEYAAEASLDSLYNHPGIAVVASAGDTPNQVEYPASMSSVVSVGGTTLTLTSAGAYGGESAWGSTGSGCSTYETAAGWQSAVPAWTSTTCSSGRGSSDISIVADSSTGVAMYTSSGGAMWRAMGGTSIGAPIVAAIFALAGGVPAGVSAPSVLYSHPAGFRDLTTGTVGTCASTMCHTAPGYDGPTGLGSPNGISGF